LKVALATHNQGKLAELRALLSPLGWTLADSAALNLPAPVESRMTFVENALDKARHTAAASGLASIADDSGLVVPALDGAPGIHSARYAGPTASDAENLARLQRAIADLHAPRAFFYCALVFVRYPADPAPLIACGTWHGRLLTTPRGAGGFGYDRLFLDPGSGRTAAELEPAEKNRISHRGQALRRLLADLAETAGYSG
jgi:XTP/dITP diphosphohydrolase